MMDLNLDELRRLAEAATPGPWEPKQATGNHNDVAYVRGLHVRGQYAATACRDDQRYIAAMHPQTTLALLDTITELRHELKQQIDADNALVQRLRQEKEAVEQRAKAAEQSLKAIYEVEQVCSCHDLPEENHDIACAHCVAGSALFTAVTTFGAKMEAH